MNSDRPEETTLADVLAAIQAVDNKFDGLRQEVSELKTGQEQLKGELRAAKKDLGQDIDSMNASMTALQASMNGLGQSFNGLSQSFLGLKATSDAHTARLRDVDVRITEVRDELQGLNTRLDRAKIPATV